MPVVKSNCDGCCPICFLPSRIEPKIPFRHTIQQRTSLSRLNFEFLIILKFFVQAGVISLQKLLVLEKAVGQDTRSIYLIRSNPDEPEMYELQCQNQRKKRVYIDMIGEAVALRNVFLPEIKVQSQRDISHHFCLPLFSALDRKMLTLGTSILFIDK